MNHYATLADVKSALNLYDTANDTRVFALIGNVSRDIDEYCGRHFATKTEARVFPVGGRGYVFVDDLLSVTSLVADSELDNTFDGETWALNTDYVLQPDNSYPKIKILPLSGGNYALPTTAIDRYLRITGTFGYGDGTASPWMASGVTVTIATTNGTTATLSAAGITAGQTLLVGTEQMFVTVATTSAPFTATVRRGMNGTTVATHTTEAASIALYPGRVVEGAIKLCKTLWVENPGITEEQFSDGTRYKRGMDYEAILDRVFKPFARVNV